MNMPMELLIYQDTHSCVTRNLRIMGLRSEQIRNISTDDEYRMNVTQLEQEIIKDIKKGKKPFVVVATAGTTNTEVSTHCMTLLICVRNMIYGCMSMVLMAVLC